MKKMIKTICFDFGGVYVHSRRHTWKDNWKYYQKFIGKKFTYSIYCEHQKLLDTGKTDLREHWQNIFNEINLSNPKLFNKLIKHKPKKHKIKKNIHNLVLKLKKRGFNVVLISNTIKPSAKSNRERGYYKVFDKLFLSSEVGFSKSDDSLYKFVLKNLKLKASECVAIDDNPDFLGEASKLGMNVIHFKNAKQVETELKNLGLDF